MQWLSLIEDLFERSLIMEVYSGHLSEYMQEPLFLYPCRAEPVLVSKLCLRVQQRMPPTPANVAEPVQQTCAMGLATFAGLRHYSLFWLRLKRMIGSRLAVFPRSVC